ERDRLEGGVDRKGHVEILSGREDRVVPRITVRYPRDGERADKRASAAVPHRALELARRLAGVAERQMGDGDETAPGVATEISDPAVIRAAMRAGELGVEQLGLPEQAERGVEHGLRHALAVEELDPLLHVHRAEGGSAEISLVGPRLHAAHLVG